MLTRDEADGAAEVMLTAYCRACGCTTPDEVRKACYAETPSVTARNRNKAGRISSEWERLFQEEVRHA